MSPQQHKCHKLENENVHTRQRKDAYCTNLLFYIHINLFLFATCLRYYYLPYNKRKYDKNTKRKLKGSIKLVLLSPFCYIILFHDSLTLNKTYHMMITTRKTS